MSDIANFLQNFQDMYVDKKTTIDLFPDNLTSTDIILIFTQLETIATELNTLSELVKNGSIEAYSNYSRIIKSLEDKINYIGDTSDILLKVNSYFDKNQIRDLYNYDLRSAVTNETIVFDNYQSALTLRSKSNIYKCAKRLENNTITFYNTNGSYHSGISFESPYLDMLDVKSISIRKIDGSIITLPVPILNNDSVYINHELLTSTQIVVEFNVNPSLSGDLILGYYQSLELSLIDYRYVTEGYFTLNETKYKSTDILSILSDFILPANCYCNVILNMDLLDINDYSIYNTEVSIPLNGDSVCKRLDNIDFDSVKEIRGMYIKNVYTTEDLDKEYLLSLNNTNEKYIIYKSKLKEEVSINDYVSSISNLGFSIKNKNVKSIRLNLELELFSFNEKVSPIIKNITGITKDETV